MPEESRCCDRPSVRDIDDNVSCSSGSALYDIASIMNAAGVRSPRVPESLNKCVSYRRRWHKIHRNRVISLSVAAAASTIYGCSSVRRSLPLASLLQQCCLDHRHLLHHRLPFLGRFARRPPVSARRLNPAAILIRHRCCRRRYRRTHHPFGTVNCQMQRQ